MKREIEDYFDRLWPINRSLTGQGNRDSLKILSEIAELDIKEVPSGTQCYDWTVPPEWNVKEAWIKDKAGNVIVDITENNLHLVGYSEPFKGWLSLDELKQHLHSLPGQPDVVPYLTSYYKRSWGFCISHNLLQSLKDGQYEVLIDSCHDEKGSMTVAEAVIKGESEREILISTYICHPSMANNELSGPLVAAFLCRELKKKSPGYYTLRFLFMPETVGAIWYLSGNGDRLKENLTAGYVLTCIGDRGRFTYKRSRRGNTSADEAAEFVLNASGVEYVAEDFFPTGSDERQYCSPGFDLPVGSIMRTRYGKYNEYHTSADNKSFISFEAMEEAVGICLSVIEMIDMNGIYINLMPYCEPQLGKRGLYPTLGSQKETSGRVEAMMWMLNQSDGSNDIFSISRKSGIGPETLAQAAVDLVNAGLIKRMN